ncbi:MAG TPA: formate/nitrite transporter family protein [Anaerolineaceae bacterium]|nr:formate/nitrite transporter family protein [Anaerolineaceae bacterium]
MAENTVVTDDLSPAEIAAKTVNIGIKKANLDFWTMFFLALFGGAYIALGAILATTVATNGPDFPFGVNSLLKGLIFTVGLILVLVAGAELFTGNNLILMAVLAKKVTVAKMLRNWGVVYLGNLIGSLIIALVMLLSKQYLLAGGALGKTVLTIANTKAGLDFWSAIGLGIMCNLLVCLAVWMSFSARTTAGKILAIIPPITAFVAAGFEHSVANMYFIPIGLLIKWTNPEFVTKAGDFGNLTIGNFFVRNLLPVTIGNLIGGALFVGAMYWFIYLRKQK